MPQCFAKLQEPLCKKTTHCKYIQIHHHTNNQVEIFLTGPRYWRSSANAAPPMPEAVAKQDLNAVPQTSPNAKVNLNVNSFWIVSLSTSDKVVDLRISHVKKHLSGPSFPGSRPAGISAEEPSEINPWNATKSKLLRFFFWYHFSNICSNQFIHPWELTAGNW